jgi:acetolactate synthase-1/2/3 large subunit
MEAHGLRAVFGLPGSHNLELFDALRSSALLKTYLATSELTASFMAEAHGKATGTAAVLAVVAGPGFTYALTGIAGARLESIPMLIIVAGCRNDLEEKKYHIHEMNIEGIAQHVAKSFFKIDDIKECDAVIAAACQEMYLGEPGPVVVEVPANILRARKGINTFLQAAPLAETNAATDELLQGKLRQAAQWINTAKLPCLYIGQGSFNARDEIIQLAEILASPIATTISGRGAVSEKHPLSLGYGFSSTGTAAARKVFASADVLVSIGCKFSEIASGGWDLKIPKKHIRIDVSEEVLNSNFTEGLAIQMDAQTAIKTLLPFINPPNKTDSNWRMDHIKRNSQQKEVCEVRAPEGKILPAAFFKELRQTLPHDGILCCDCGAHQFFALSDFAVYEPRTFLTSVDFQAMGFSIPAAIAAQIAFPERKVAAIVGDGGTLMTGLELVNASREKITPTIFIFCDSSLGLIEKMQQRIFQRAFSVSLQNPDYPSLAAAVGAEYSCLNDEKNLQDQLQHIMTKNVFQIVEVVMHYDGLPHYARQKMNATARKMPLTGKIMAGSRILSRKLLAAKNNKDIK